MLARETWDQLSPPVGLTKNQVGYAMAPFSFLSALMETFFSSYSACCVAFMEKN